jgi:hypothetical protein
MGLSSEESESNERLLGTDEDRLGLDTTAGEH